MKTTRSNTQDLDAIRIAPGQNPRRARHSLQVEVRFRAARRAGLRPAKPGPVPPIAPLKSSLKSDRGRMGADSILWGKTTPEGFLVWQTIFDMIEPTSSSGTQRVQSRDRRAGFRERRLGRPGECGLASASERSFHDEIWHAVRHPVEDHRMILPMMLRDYQRV